MIFSLASYKECVRSADGTLITFDVSGHGPGIIVLHGVLAGAFNYRRLADLLSESFTVYLVERRGRGLSGPQGKDYTIQKECEDLEAVRAHTGAPYLFGHSYGGLIALEYAKRFNGFGKISVYEPGVSIDGSIVTDWILPYEKFLSQKNYHSALSIFIKNSGTPLLRKLPLWLIKFILFLKLDSVKRIQLYSLLNANLLEHLAIAETDSTVESYKSILTPLLILSGKKTKLGWTFTAVAALKTCIRKWKAIEFTELDHFGPEKSPQEIVPVLKDYFLVKSHTEIYQV